MLADFEFERLEGGTLRLRRRKDASPGVAFTIQRPQGLVDLATAVFGRKMRIEFVEAGAGQSRNAAPATDDSRAAMEHPLVQEAMDLFDAHVVQVRRASPRPDSSGVPDTPED